MEDAELYPYYRWLIEQERYADLWLRKFLRVRKNLYKDVKQFDPWRTLSRCEKCGTGFWGETNRCKKHKIYPNTTGHEKYKFYYDRFGNKIPT